MLDSGARGQKVAVSPGSWDTEQDPVSKKGVRGRRGRKGGRRARKKEGGGESGERRDRMPRFRGREIDGVKT